MSELDEIRDRVTRLERDMVNVRADATAARVLAGGADRDVSQMREELRTHTRTLNSLRETQLEQGELLAEHGQRLTSLERKVDDGFSELRSEMQHGFSTFGVGMAQITALLTTHLRDCPGEA